MPGLCPAALLLLASAAQALQTGESSLALAPHWTPPPRARKPAARFAFATLVAEPKWIAGAFALGCSLKDFAQRNNVDMVAFCYDLDEESQREVAFAGWRCEQPTMVANPKKNQWRYDFTAKLAPFRLTQYERVVVMDNDMLAVNANSLAELFRLPFPEGNIMAVPDCAAHFMPRWTQNERSIMVQGGLLVLRPNETAYSRLVDQVPKVKSLDGGAQGFVSKVFNGSVTWLPAKFNYIRASNCVHLVNPSTGFYRFGNVSLELSRRVPFKAANMKARADIAAGNVSMAHFHFLPKPWDCDPSNADKCGVGWYFGNSGINVIYEAWLNVSNRCHRAFDMAASGRI